MNNIRALASTREIVSVSYLCVFARARVCVCVCVIIPRRLTCMLTIAIVFVFVLATAACRANRVLVASLMGDSSRRRKRSSQAGGKDG